MAYRFTWILPDLLAGMACPGYFTALEADLDYLAAAGVRHIVTLTEFPLALPPASVFQAHHLPVGDFGAPNHDQAEAFCRLVDQAGRDRQAVVVHCLAGIGRTGTFIAAYVMWKQGLNARQALSHVRGIRREYVQSVEQEAWLEDWEVWLAAHPGR